MKYAKINDCDTINVVSGVSVSLWTQGCPHECSGCFNESTWDANRGYDFSVKSEFELIKKLDNSYITTFSILGGEPFSEQNREDVSWLTKTVRLLFPEKKIMVWTGYRLEDVFKMNLDIGAIDYIIDGRFVEALADKNLKLRGSSNQTVWKRCDNEWTPLTNNEVNCLFK
ncbi:MAG: anaerobic ribonucleoside-triphosphate reductase activating protein [Cellulosilyticaceae bacterium]